MPGTTSLDIKRDFPILFPIQELALTLIRNSNQNQEEGCGVTTS